MKLVVSAGMFPARELPLVMRRRYCTAAAGADTEFQYQLSGPTDGGTAHDAYVRSMNTAHAVQRVEVTCVGTVPVRQIERAAGVSDVEVDGTMVRCVLTGSFQPLLEALRGYEVISLQSTPA